MNKFILLGLAIGAIIAGMIAFQIFHFYRFINVGPRFTAHDGQTLCERVRALELGLNRSAPACPYGPPTPPSTGTPSPD